MDNNNSLQLDSKFISFEHPNIVLKKLNTKIINKRKYFFISFTFSLGF
jgi:hypothetical protein